MPILIILLGQQRSLAWSPLLLKSCCIKLIWGYTRSMAGHLFSGSLFRTHPRVSTQLSHGQALKLGDVQLEVRHTPGHTPGHVVFYCPGAEALFCGDVIFQSGIGRTDLPGGSYAQLIDSIQQQVMTLPDLTRLYSGHGPATSVGLERAYNPFLNH